MAENIEIPFYALYGDTFIRTKPGFIHVESIDSRSRELSWKIQPHRHGKLAQLIYVQDSSWHTQLDDRAYTLSGNWLVTIPPGVVHSFHFAPNTRGYVLSVDMSIMSDQVIQEELGDVLQAVWKPAAIEFRNDRQLARITSLIQLLHEELHFLDKDEDRYTLNLLKLIMLTVSRQIATSEDNAKPMQRETKIMLRFRELIEEHYLQHMSVKNYAALLHISVSTLSRLCQQMLGESPKQVILQRLLNEGRRRLIYTRQSVEDIAYTLGYKDPAYFCRQFKRTEGVSPGSFRQTNAY
ncbi:hypothetical protein BM524_00415 [Alteromonas mediterranea]|uniref:HTH araC/xylS-type domain-containing protein n=1 Tax=Alteromonas mediterranea TaxID=314275 RepID=A0AAC9J6J5_9ALTE|nr:helix-turn-helix domain-containing protein [Alteromonas mediterranea]APD88386.1 hypothetical protein BM524_00415 [Alteromonas mediterranea]